MCARQPQVQVVHAGSKGLVPALTPRNQQPGALSCCARTTHVQHLSSRRSNQQQQQLPWLRPRRRIFVRHPQLHFLVRGSTSEEDICASRVFTGFEDRQRLATLWTGRNIVRQHQNCSFASIQAQTFRIGFKNLSRLANSTLKLCSANRHDGHTQDLTATGSQIGLRVNC